MFRQPRFGPLFSVNMVTFFLPAFNVQLFTATLKCTLAKHGNKEYTKTIWFHHFWWKWSEM